MGSITYEDDQWISERKVLHTDSRFSPMPKEEHAKYRNLVPLLAQQDLTYVNASFQPPMNSRVRGAIDQFLDQASTNPHPKPHWQQVGQEAKEKLSAYLHVPTHSLAFTRDTTEALNLFQRSLKFSQGDNVVLLDVEHPNQVYGWLGLQHRGLEIRRIPTGEDTFADADTFAPYIDDNTVAIGLSSIMFHTGQLNDVEGICSRFRPAGIHVLLDMTQQVGVTPIDLTRWNASAAAFSCHKGLGCPTGLGVLYVNPVILESLESVPPIVGAGAIANLPSNLIADYTVRYHSSSRKYEHLNLSLIATTALKASLKLLIEDFGIDNIEKHLRGLGRHLSIGCQELGVSVVGSRYAEERAPHLYVLKLLDPAWQEHFQAHRVYLSHYRCGVRVSLGFYNNVQDVNNVLQTIRSGLEKGIPPH